MHPGGRDILLAMFPLPAMAVSYGYIAGYLSDNSTGDPVTDAMVYIFDSPSQPPVGFSGMNASRDIEFTFKPDKAGVYTLDVDGTQAGLTVREAAAEPGPEEPPAEAAPGAPSTTPAAETTPPAPTSTTAVVTETPAAAAPPTTPELPPLETTETSWFNDWIIFLGVALAGIVFLAIIYWRTRLRKTS
jgi:hypothetical protein